MKRALRLLLVALVPWLAFAVVVEGDCAEAPAPVVVHRSSSPATLAAGEYEIVSIVQDFPPGSAAPRHSHGGSVVVTVLSGELTLRDKDGERVVKAGGSWAEKPGEVHSVVNAGAQTARVAASFVLPKGAELTTVVK